MRINDAFGQMTAAFLDWHHVLANPRYVRKDRVITWANYQPMFLRPPITNFDLIRLSEEGQYTFQALDGSILQMFYAYGESDDEPIEARLAYYMTEKQQGAEERDTGGALDAVPISWLRIDYSQNEGGVLHSAAHLHLDGFPGGRLTVMGVPTPRQFVELIVSIAYPDDYHKHRLNDAGAFREPAQLDHLNSVCVRLAERRVYSMVPHLRVPAYP